MRPRTLAVALCVISAALVAQPALAGEPSTVTAAKAWTFTGSGTKRIGTVKLRRAATLRWRKGRGTLRITGTRGFRLLETRSRRGSITVRRGTYRRLTVSAPSSWRITIRER